MPDLAVAQVVVVKRITGCADAAVSRYLVSVAKSRERETRVTSGALADAHQRNGALDRRPPAHEIGTHDLSARVREYCLISEGPTATRARPETLVRQEEELDETVLSSAVAEMVELDLRGLRLAPLVAAGLFTDEIPDGALVVDMRDGAEDDPLAGAVRRTETELRRDFREFERDRPIVLVCRQGMVSASVAERMQAAGYEAYSLRGGVRRLRRLRAEAAE